MKLKMKEKMKALLERDRRFEISLIQLAYWQNKVGVEARKDLKRALSNEFWWMTLSYGLIVILLVVMQTGSPDHSGFPTRTVTVSTYLFCTAVFYFLRSKACRRAKAFVMWMEALEAHPYFRKLSKPLHMLDLPEEGRLIELVEKGLEIGEMPLPKRQARRHSSDPVIEGDFTDLSPPQS